MAARDIDQLLAIVAREVSDGRVLRAMREVPREDFVPGRLRDRSYEDRALPLPGGQAISQPTIVALMTEAALLEGGERVLEIGTGSGYQAAVLSRLAREVVTVEVDAALQESARKRLAQLGYANVTALAATGELGVPELAPFDAILVTAAAPRIPPPLTEQLAEGGRIVIPVGTPGLQQLIVAKRARGQLTRRSLGACRFVPLLGAHGFRG